MKYITLILPLILLLLPACNRSAPTAPTAVPSPAPTIAAPLPSPTAPVFESPLSSGETETPTAQPQPDEPVIEFKRSGGFAGREETFLIYADGRVESNGQAGVQIDAAEVEAVLSHADAAGFFQLDESYLAQNPCCDRFTYQLTLRYGGQEHSVVTIDDADKPPAALQSTLEAVDTLIANTR